VAYLMKKEQGYGDLGRGHHRRARQGHGEGQQDSGAEGHASAGRLHRKAHHHRDRRAATRAARGLEPDKKLVWTYFEAMNPDKMPKSLLVVGSGAIGIEFASFYKTLGADGHGGRGAAADPAR
jgi:NADPH-dependent 2,4-dienoyl-CoA reductase/sulfur reductase-like enzyme